MSRHWYDIRYSLRQLRKSPIFALTVLLTLAIGIGATTAIHTVFYAALLAPLPYTNPDQVVIVQSTIRGGRTRVSPADYMDWEQQNHVFQDLKAFYSINVNLGDGDGLEQVELQFVRPGLYKSLGLQFQLGRDFLPEEGEVGKDQVVTLTNRLWKRLGADPNIIGKQLLLDKRPYTVVGVLTPHPTDSWNMHLTAPLAFKPEHLNRDERRLQVLVLGRLKAGVTIEQANADLNLVAARLAEAYPRSNTGWGANVAPLQASTVNPNARLTLWLFAGAVGFVLLIACVNVSNLFVAKGTTRRKEISIRYAVGARRRDVFVQVVTESLAIAGVGGIIGGLVGFALLQSLLAALAAMPQNLLPRDADIRLNLPVLLITLGATAVAGLLFGSAPAWYASHVEPVDALKEGGRSGAGKTSHRLLRSLVIGEFALALTLLAGAGLAMRSFWNLTSVDLGINTDRVLTFRLPTAEGGPSTPEQALGRYRQVLSSIQAAPGVESVAAMTGMPLQGPGRGTPFTIGGQAAGADPSQQSAAGLQMVTPDYFKTFGIQVIKGRAFTDQDNAGSAHVAMINEKLANRFFPGQDPLGQQLMLPQFAPGAGEPGPPQAWEIVGVFNDVRGGGFNPQFEEINIPYYQSPAPSVGVAVRTAGDPSAMTRTISAAVHAVDPDVALVNVKTLDQIRNETLANPRFVLLLYVCFGAVALALAVVGIYGVMAFTVGQRTRDIGVRMALGASRAQVVRTILGEGAIMASAGLALGSVGAYFVGRAMRGTLYGVSSFDLPAFAAVGALLLTSALVACYVPARRAAAIEPMEALRSE